MRELSEQYVQMETKDICALPVQELAANDCALFMWVTDSHIPDALCVIQSWGFIYKTIAFVWAKKTTTWNTCSNYAPWTMKNCEICLLATKGHPQRQRRNIRQLIEAIRTEHSKKPDEVRHLIVKLMGDKTRIELFARQRVSGWDVFGNEVESDVYLGTLPNNVLQLTPGDGRENSAVFLQSVVAPVFRRN